MSSGHRQRFVQPAERGGGLAARVSEARERGGGLLHRARRGGLRARNVGQLHRRAETLAELVLQLEHDALRKFRPHAVRRRECLVVAAETAKMIFCTLSTLRMASPALGPTPTRR